jgi:hypothetical protein
MWRHPIRSEQTGYKSYPPSTGLARRVQPGIGDSDYKLQSGRWHTHGLQAHEISPVHYVVLSGDILWVISPIDYVVLSGDILWVTGYVP